MKGLLKHNDFWSVDAALMTVVARHFDGRLVGFTTRITKEHFIQTGDFRDTVCRGLLIGNDKQIGGMNDTASNACVECSVEAWVSIA